MQLSTFLPNISLGYAEFAWVTQLSAVRQTVPVNTIRSVYMNAVLKNTITGAGLSAGSAEPTGNVNSYFTLPAGRYYFEADLGAATSGSTGGTDMILGLYNNTLSAYVSRKQLSENNSPFSLTPLNGMIEISATSQFSVRFVAGREFNIGYGFLNNVTPIVNPALSADQRTTVKVWKLK